jgi:hypothetical protein
MFEAMAELYPEHADVRTACATMEWCKIHYIEPLGHEAGVHVSLEEAEKLGQEGAAFVRHASFKHVAKVTIDEIPAADALYKDLGKHPHSPELKALADDFYEHENALRDWLKSELDGKSDGGEKVFAYLERHGMSREEAVTPRKTREDLGGDTRKLVLAFFDTEDAADQAATALTNWEKATEYMQVDAIGVLVKASDGKVKEHKLGRRAGKHGMGIGVALGVVAAIPAGGLSLVGGVLGRRRRRRRHRPVLPQGPEDDRRGCRPDRPRTRRRPRGGRRADLGLGDRGGLGEAQAAGRDPPDP